jgi:2-dehydro-3-deoxygluconokinase
VARGLRRCFNQRTAIVTSIPDCPTGRLLEDLMLQGGVDLSLVKWAKYDGLGRRNRVGLNFTERGYGVRAARGCSDRGHTAISALKPGDIDWKRIFGELGSRWFHTGGIFAALSASCSDVALEAVQAAQESGTIVSYDLNYRPSLWDEFGGQEKAREVNQKLAPYIDVMLGNEEDFSAALGFEVEGVDDDFSELDVSGFKKMIGNVVKAYPNLKAVATTLRNAKTATFNDWGGILYYGDTFYEATHRQDLEILDRVGGGDSFASGLIYGFLTEKEPQEIVEYAAAHGALAMTTAGDTTTASLSEVERLVGGGSARIAR